MGEEEGSGHVGKKHRAINVLITVSATLSAVCHAPVASISAKDAVAQFDSTTDALCLFVALGFLAPLRSTKHPDRACVKQFVTVSE